MSGGWSYSGGVIHDEFCDTVVGSGRGKEEEDGREGKYDGVNRGSSVLKRREPTEAETPWPSLGPVLSRLRRLVQYSHIVPILFLPPYISFNC
jgi:hypothetical protein